MTHEETAINKVGSTYVLEQMGRIEAQTLCTTIDELLIGITDKRAIHLVNEMYDYIILQKRLIEELATAVRLQDHPILETGFVPMSRPVRRL